MTIRRMDHVGVVVDDLEAATAFFVELAMEFEGGQPARTSSVFIARRLPRSGPRTI